MNTIERPSLNGHAPQVEAIVTAPTRGRRTPWRTILALCVVLALIVTTVVVIRVRSTPNVVYTTTPVVRGDLVQSVTATGTVNPQNTIAVGTQVSGTLSELDVDYNSHVRKGQVLAKIDPTTFQAALDAAGASLAQSEDQARAASAGATGAVFGIGSATAAGRAAQATAQAAVATARMNVAAVAAAQTNVAKSASALSLAQQTVQRDTGLIAQGFIAQSQLDTDRSNLVAAQSALQAAHVAVQQAQLQASASQSQAVASAAQTSASAFQTSTAQSQAATQSATAAASNAAIAIQRAQVQTAQTNLQHTIITSPVDGTIVARDVSVGQTVAASLQTPTLFSIAQDLGKMEVDLSVGEPDIGNVRAGETVNFNVLAYPNQTFHGNVSQVRINPTTLQNVVTYTTVVLVDNKSGQLLPGMTANASIDTARAAQALIVPLAAFTYTPAGGAAKSGRHRTAAGAASASPWGATNGGGSTSLVAGTNGRIFVQRGGSVVRVPVTIALVNGTQAAVKPVNGATLTVSDAVITADSSTATPSGASNAAAKTSNPLTGGGGMNTRGIH